MAITPLARNTWDDPGGLAAGTSTSDSLGRRGRACVVLRRHGLALGLAAVFVLVGLVVVPYQAPVGASDDWVYARSVERLVSGHGLQVSGLAVASVVFQVVWGALFAKLLGFGFAALRLSTAVLFLLSGGAFYLMLLELRLTPARAALGTAAYLFNPLAFVLAFTFMSDGQFCALVVIATALFVRAVRRDRADTRWLIAASAVSALAFLVRQQGMLIPLAVVVALAAKGRLRLDRSGLALLAKVLALPLVAACGYWLWMRAANGVPDSQRLFVHEVKATGWQGAAVLVVVLAVVELAYLGLFVLPLAPAALARLRALRRGLNRERSLAVTATVGAVVAGASAYAISGRWMPYVPQFLDRSGLGPMDLLGDPPVVLTPIRQIALTAACLIALAALAIALGGGMAVGGGLKRRGSSAVCVLLAVTAGQAIGVLPPSFHFYGIVWNGVRNVSVDRYLLPMLPLVVALALVALRSFQMSLRAGWVLVVAFALVAVAGTRDYLVRNQAIWSLADRAIAAGVAPTQLDAGAAWDGWHLGGSQYFGRPAPRTPHPPWWVDLFAPLTDSTYVVASSPIPRYEQVWKTTYSSWLSGADRPLYLLRRPGAAVPQLVAAPGNRRAQT